MHTRIFAATSKPVSEIGLGTWQLGGAEWGEVSDAQAIETLSAAADAGCTFLDTADIYGMGRSETLIGQFLSGRSDRERFFVASKLGRHPNPGIPANFTPKAVIEHTELSLKRLGIDSLDLTQTHCIPLEVMQRGEVFGTLAKLQHQGKIRAWGASVQSCEEAIECLKIGGLASLQIIFNIFRQKPIDAFFDLAKSRGVSLIVRLPVASGLLAGRFDKATQFAPTDHRNFNRDGDKFNVGETFAGLPFEIGVSLAEKIRPLIPEGMTMAQFALRWILDFDAVTTVIPGAKIFNQARMNAAASDFPPLPALLHNRLGRFYSEDVAEHIRGVY